MLGSIIGDVCGSKYEHNNIKNIDFNLFDKDCFFTDDTVCTIAIAKALLDCNNEFIDLQQKCIENLRYFCNKYNKLPYGEMFKKWLKSDCPQPYFSYGNGAAMRVSPVSYVAQNIEQVKSLSYKVTSITHNDPQGLKGAEAVAICVFLARKGYSKTEIKQYIQDNYYDLSFDMQELRDSYCFDVSCDGSVPQAIYCFLQSKSFENAIKIAISIGGDSDTIACITGSIAQGYYGIPNMTQRQCLDKLPQEFIDVYNEFSNKYN